VRGARHARQPTPPPAVVLATGAIESTRLALESFATPLMGRNLVAHLRSNTTVRIKRATIDATLPQRLEAAALLVRGSTPAGRYHLQVTAAAVHGADAEAVMFRMVPDLDLLGGMLASEDAESIVITFRGIGEMQASKDPAAGTLTGSAPSGMDLCDQRDEYGMRRAWVNLLPNATDIALWRTMDDAALAFAQALAGDPANIEYFYNATGSLNAPRGMPRRRRRAPASIATIRRTRCATVSARRTTRRVPCGWAPIRRRRSRISTAACTTARTSTSPVRRCSPRLAPRIPRSRASRSPVARRKRSCVGR
jgi:hypothetical protein